MSDVIAYCRAGFEAECAAELDDHARCPGPPARPEAGSAFVVRPCPDAPAAPVEAALRLESMVFARQLLFRCRWLPALSPNDRITSIVGEAAGFGARFGDAWIETADTNDAKELQRLCRALSGPLMKRLHDDGLVAADRDGAPRLHVFLQTSTSAYLGVTWPGNRSDWPMGIPRLKMPGGAPSRSTLKLEEALLVFLDESERAKRLRPGMRAVDLGAAPGGWTWQLAKRQIRVVAVDNGAMDADLMASGLVEHRREDCFRFRPRKPVDWLVCDVVEQPGRIAALVADWCRNGWCREAIFNLKLPMKRRYQALLDCRADMEARLDGRRHQLRFKQLYHDREEVTGHCRLR